jgi:3-hydroxyacyl-CoA dehydrogenase/enoyl-CoA hydratase/3-hydroxybutyryl-CoA epimerase
VPPSLSLIRDGATTTVILASPILARRVLCEIAATLDELRLGPSPPPLVLASDHPTIFLAGAHLREIAALDQHNCIPYAELGRSVADRLASHPAPVVAAVHGSCSGGGFDLTMACDAVIASPNATFSHPGVHRGLVTGWGGSTSLARVLGPSVLRRALLEGSDLDATTMKELGYIHAIADDPRAQARFVVGRLSLLHASRLAAWRLLRGSTFVDRFRAFVVEKS